MDSEALQAKMHIAIIAITRNGVLLGKKLRESIVGSELYVSSRYAGQAGRDRILFESGDLKELLASLGAG